MSCHESNIHRQLVEIKLTSKIEIGGYNNILSMSKLRINIRFYAIQHNPIESVAALTHYIILYTKITKELQPAN